MTKRDDTIARLDGEAVDLLVVGAGIVGSRIAYEAAQAGLRVALIDAGDFGGATSSASSKLVHGGLRYLATGDFGLVRRLHRERLSLTTQVAPYLVRPLPLILVAERGRAARSAKLAAALALYGAVAGSREALPRLVSAASATQLVPGLDPASAGLCGIVRESQTHDARLTLATVRGAAQAGALVANHVRLVDFQHERGAVRGAILHDAHGGATFTVRCHAAVNATGPWIDHVRRLDQSNAMPLARLSKGVHAVLPLDQEWRAGVAVFDELRSAFAVPWQGLLLVGATDEEYDDGPGAVTATEADLDAVLAPLQSILTLDRRAVLSSFAGLRVLPRTPGETSRASREHLVETSSTGLVSVAGGKLTSHRRIAMDVLAQIPAGIRPHATEPLTAPLPGAGGISTRGVDPEIASHLTGLYGSDMLRVLAYDGALERVHPNGPDVMGQVFFARDSEYALTIDDIVARRTTLGVRGCDSADVRGRILEALGGDGAPQITGVAGAALNRAG